MNLGLTIRIVGGMQLFAAEAPGPTTNRLKPRVQDTARLLWSVYALVTLGGVVLLWLGEMDLYDALCHGFSAVSTGGFSPRNNSMGAFDTYSQLVIIVMMALGGANFSLHYHARPRSRRGRPHGPLCPTAALGQTCADARHAPWPPGDFHRSRAFLRDVLAKVGCIAWKGSLGSCV